jgi:hypothetical protein
MPLFSLTRTLMVPLWVLASAATLAQTASLPVPQTDGSALNACLIAWGNHPFGSRPVYTRLSTSVKLAGVGPATADPMRTDHPTLILVDPTVNALGDASLVLSNPNGWYCLRAPANELGALRIQLHCRARLAAASGGATVWGSGHGETGVTKLGALQVERIGCEGG